MARRLRPGVLEDLGLVSALDLARPRSSPPTPGCTSYAGSHRACRRLDPEAELVLYRVAQEALTNVARHAEADRVELSCASTDGLVVLRVARRRSRAGSRAKERDPRDA